MAYQELLTNRFKEEFVLAAESFYNTTVEFNGDIMIVLSNDKIFEVKITDYLFMAGHYVTLRSWNVYSIACLIVNEIIEEN